MGLVKNALNTIFRRTETGAAGRTLRSKLADTLWVEDFGAVGDGVTNDLPAFNAAIAAFTATGTHGAGGSFTRGNCLRLGPKTYALSGTLNITRPLILEGAAGDGWYPASILTFPANTRGIVLHDDHTLAGNSVTSQWSTIRNVQLQGQTGGTVGTVNTSGLTVTWGSGTQFNTSTGPDKWGQWLTITIGAQTYVVDTIASATSLTVQPWRAPVTAINGSTAITNGNSQFPFSTAWVGASCTVNGEAHTIAAVASDGQSLTLNSNFGKASTSYGQFLLTSLGTRTGVAYRANVYHGVDVYVNCRIENVFCSNFAGNGFSFDTGRLGLGGQDTNANCFAAFRCYAYYNRGHGFFTRGINSNAGVITGGDFSSNHGAGVWEQGFLGNTYSGLHTSFNGQGAYIADSVLANNTFNGCYSEGGQVASRFGQYSIVTGGTHGAGISTETQGIVISAGNVAHAGNVTGLRSQRTTGATLLSEENAGTVSAFLGVNDDAGTALAIGSGDEGISAPPNYRLNYGWMGTGWWSWIHNLDSFRVPLMMSGANADVGPGKLCLPYGFYMGLQTTRRQWGIGATAPTSGAHIVGNIWWNINPVAGGNVGWKCVTAGTPGTWEAFGAPGGGGGVSSFAKSGSTALTGAVTLSPSTNITLTQTGQDIAIAATGGGGSTGTLCVDDAPYSAVGNGTTDDAAAFNAAIAALPAAGGTILLTKANYAIAAPLNGAKSNVRFVSARDLSTLKRIAGGSYDGFAHVDIGPYSGWSFERVGFDGNRVTLGAGAQAFYLRHTEQLTFRDGLFRDCNVTMGAVRDVTFERCRFYGTRAGVMASGAQDPAAVTTASFGYGPLFADDCHRCKVLNCLFHFCQNGIVQNTSAGMSDGFLVEGNTFRGEWWNLPYITKRFTPTAYNSSTRVLTVSGGGFTGFFPSFEVISIPIAVVNGASLANLYGNMATAATAVFGSVRAGDVLEMADGTRAEIMKKESTTVLHLRPWESVDTFEPIATPSPGQAWRIRRYYSASASFTSDTTITLTNDPTSVHTGERLVGDAGLTPVGISCRAHAKVNYEGLHVNADVRNVLVTGNTFRGSWGDQCSIFGCPQPQVIGNHFEYGWDMAITVYTSPGVAVHGNSIRYEGTGCISFGGTDHGSAVGNTIDSWGVNHYGGVGAIEGNGLAMVIVGNTITRDTTTGFGGDSRHAIHLHDSNCTGTLISANVDALARTSTLNVDAAAAPTAGAVVARDVATITGAGAANVSTGGSSGGGMAIGSPVTGGTATRLLFVDGSGNLGHDSALVWDDTNNRLGVNGGNYSTANLIVHASDDTNNPAFALLNASGAAKFVIGGDGSIAPPPFGVGGSPYSTARLSLYGGTSDGNSLLTGHGTSQAITFQVLNDGSIPVVKSVAIGGGTAVTGLVVYTPTLSPVAVAANTTVEQTFGITGLTTSDTILACNKPTAQAGLGIVGFRVSGTNQLGITFSNNSGSSITPTASQVYRIVAIRS